MIREPARPRHATLGPLGRRLFAAFLVVALSSVAVLTVAALVGTDRGMSAARQTERERTAERSAAAAAAAYSTAGGWQDADLSRARAIAEGSGARLVVMDRTGEPVTSARPGRGGPGTGPGMGPGMGTGHGRVEARVVSDGKNVGTVRLVYGTPAADPARSIAWGWIAAAAVMALAVALVVSRFVTVRLIGPLREVTRTAGAIAAGDRSARSEVMAPGELGELARTFDLMAEEVDRAERIRRELAADVAHELRTPLATLQAGLEELRDGFAEPGPERLAALHDQALRLGRIVDDLGELAAAEAAALSLRLRETDLAELVRAVLADHEPELRAAELEVHAEPAPGVLVRADPDRLHQALGNLLANAARYCGPGDRVTVGVRAEGNEAVVEVADTGPGIAPDDLEHVFDRLWRGRSSGGVAGSGIGLAVVRELVTAHHGTVRAASGPSGGATFTIRLPLAGTAVPG